ncbi:hypothetical protein [Sphingomonas beigongshangi]|uniref:hypothetical protein n=1 Tax=Sphingomonas beigongshangi TaxID=2782540 RepID=UPI001EEDC072|nr:hypothetical protein [Sphingomonas beigongshangi]
MIYKGAATMGALLPVAAAAIAGDKGATVATSQPLIWNFVGYPFEAGSMIAGICACLAVRFYVTAKAGKEHRWTLDWPVSALALLFTAGAIMRLRPDPALALIYGTGLGAMGVTIITVALNFVQSRIPGADESKPPA